MPRPQMLVKSYFSQLVFFKFICRPMNYSLVGLLKSWQIKQVAMLLSRWISSKSSLLDNVTFGMPKLAQYYEETSYIVIPSTVCPFCGPQYLGPEFDCYFQVINFLYNVQHDCSLSKCTASGKQPLM